MVEPSRLTTYATAAILLMTLSAQAAPPAHRNDPRAAIFVGQIRDALDANLKDYPSARFREVKIAFTETGHRLVCGQFNAKGGGGGYMGWQAFFVDQPDAAPPKLIFGENCPGWDVVWLPTDYAKAVASK